MKAVENSCPHHSVKCDITEKAVTCLILPVARTLGFLLVINENDSDSGHSVVRRQKKAENDIIL